LKGAIFSKSPQGPLIKFPSSILPFHFPGIDALGAPELVIELIKSKPFQDFILRVEKLNVKDTVIAPVPDLVILKKAGRFLFFNLHVPNIPGLLIGGGNEVFIAEKMDHTNKKDHKKQRQSDAIKADSPCLQGSNLTMSGKRSKGEQDREEDCIGKSPLKGDFREPIEKIFEDQVKRGLVSVENVHLLKEDDNHVDEDKAAQA
jgi:hypothetical protein